MHGPPPPNWMPFFETNFHKSLPGSDECLIYPGPYHYMAGALAESGAKKIPLLNDMAGLPVPGLSTPKDDAVMLSSILAVECVKLVLPEMQSMSPDILMEFRENNKPELSSFRLAILRYSREFNKEIQGATVHDIDKKTEFFVQTEIVPALHELRATIRKQNRSWGQRRGDVMKFAADIGFGAFSGNVTASVIAALVRHVPSFLASEYAAASDTNAERKRSGLYYLLRIESAAHR